MLQTGAEAAAIGIEHPALAAALGQLAGAASGIVVGGHDHQPDPRQRGGGEAVGKPLARWEQGRHGVQLETFQTAQQGVAPAVGHLDVQLRVAVLQLLQCIEQHQVAEGLRHAQAQAAAGRRLALDQRTQRIQGALHLTALLVDPQAHGCRLERLGMAVEQFGAESFLEVLHAAGDGRLGQFQRVGGHAQGLAAHHRHEGVEVIRFHAHSAY
ncbi:hypothetical protein D3C78_922750 [compost metagenome]